MTAAHRWKHRLRAWTQDLGFQLVVVPGLLALISLYLGDVLGRPGLAFGFTLVIVVFFFAWFFVAFEQRERSRRERALGRGGTPRVRADAVIMAMNLRAPGPDHPAHLLCDLTHAQCLGLLVTEASRPHALELRDQLARHASGAVSTVLVSLDADQETNISHVRSRAQELIDLVDDQLSDDGRRSSTLVSDVTAGTAIISIGLYEAAVSRDLLVTYLTTAPDDPLHRAPEIVEVYRPEAPPPER